MVVHEFTCPDCDITFDYPWEVGGEVRCPQCEQWFETDSEANADDDPVVPWISGKAKNNTA
jgi:hypothetical protein